MLLQCFPHNSNRGERAITHGQTFLPPARFYEKNLKPGMRPTRTLFDMVNCFADGTHNAHFEVFSVPGKFWKTLKQL